MRLCSRRLLPSHWTNRQKAASPRCPRAGRTYGGPVASIAVVGNQSDLFDLASRAGEQLRAKLGVGMLTSTEAEEVKLTLPSNPEAARLYSDGLAELQLYDDVLASDLFERVDSLAARIFASLFGLSYAHGCPRVRR